MNQKEPRPTMHMNPEQISEFAHALSESAPATPADAPRRREPARVISLEAAGERYWALELEVSDALASTLQLPAQYTTMRIGEMDARFLVIASAPGETRWRFLIDQDSTLGEALEAIDASALEISVSEAEGRGYVLEEDVRELVMLTTGSGLATMCAVLEWAARDRPALLERASLYYGERRNGDFTSVATELTRWRQAGVAIYEVSEDGATGATRYVQERFISIMGEEQPRHTTRVLLSGNPLMLRHASAALVTRGFAPAQLSTNV